MSSEVCKMKVAHDAAYYKHKYSNDYEEHNGDLGCVWCFTLVDLEDASNHITDPKHIACKERGNFVC